jgi:hypothetical protein
MEASWIDHILHTNCLVKQVTSEKVEGTRRRVRRGKQLPDDLKEKRGYWKLKEEALDRTVRRNRFGRGYRPVVKQSRVTTMMMMIMMSDYFRILSN